MPNQGVCGEKGDKMKNVLIVDHDSARRDLVADALSWVSHDLNLIEARDLDEARTYLGKIDFRLVVVGPDLPCDTRAALVFLRGMLPHSALLTSMKMLSYDREDRARLLNCGADLVFDQRMSATKLSLVFRRYIGPQQVSKVAAEAIDAADWGQALLPA